ncbi:MAG: glycosyltransferase family 39 protein [Deltaproteobacteria bacterium]|nr:glycosyltransferase family 39 protein [Deltaproteobacteria bacterium]
MPEAPTGAGSASLRSSFAIALGTALVGLAYRLWLVPRYFGHEEEDWGNLQIARGVVESGFRWLELEHMPGYAWLVAIVSLLGFDVEVAARIVAVLSGALVVGLVAWIGARWYDATTGLVAGLLVAFQPEAALYSATALRESSYLALALLGVLLCGERRFAWGGASLAAAFLIRFNAFFSLFPALLIAAAWSWRRDRKAAIGAAISAAVLGAMTAGWSVLYRLHPDGGSFNFWGGVLGRNTGGAVGDLSGPEHVEAVLEAVLGLAFRVMPGHLGPAVLLCAPVGVAVAFLALRRSQDEAFVRRAWLALCALGTLGLLFATAVVSTYEWFHNLYWKWLTPSVPFLALLGVHGARVLARSVPAAVARPLLAILVLSTGLAFGLQTQNQVDASVRMYGVQVRTARWIEEAYIEDIAVVADGIPAWYIGRKPSDRVVIRWTDPRVPSERAALGRFLFENRVASVLWFREEWIGAAEKAPYLAEGVATELGPVTLKPVAWSHEYGMIGYAVEQAHAVPPPKMQPPDGVWFPPEGQ